MTELDFWDSKSDNLNSIFEQLQGPRIRTVLRFLDKSKSTYNSPFAKLCKEVFKARSEANDNQSFLKPLRPWFAPSTPKDCRALTIQFSNTGDFRIEKERRK